MTSNYHLEFEETKNLPAHLIQEAIDLTPEQVKAVASFKRAVKKCQKTGVRFYTVLETISFLRE